MGVDAYAQLLVNPVPELALVLQACLCLVGLRTWLSAVGVVVIAARLAICDSASLSPRQFLRDSITLAKDGPQAGGRRGAQ